jgi:hypothetical protein
MSIADILKVLYGLYIHLWEKEGKQETTCEFLQDWGTAKQQAKGKKHRYSSESETGGGRKQYHGQATLL